MLKMALLHFFKMAVGGHIDFFSVSAILSDVKSEMDHKVSGYNNSRPLIKNNPFFEKNHFFQNGRQNIFF